MRWKFLGFEFDAYTRRLLGAPRTRLGKRDAKVLEFLLEKRFKKERYENEQIIEFAWGAKGSIDDLHHSIGRLRNLFQADEHDRDSIIASGPYMLVPEVECFDSTATPKATPVISAPRHGLNSAGQERGFKEIATENNGTKTPPHSGMVRGGLHELISEAGLSAFYPSRDYYSKYRDAKSIDQYVLTAKESVVMISINLMTGIPIDGLCDALMNKLKTDSKFTATISLLNPRKRYLMASLAPVLGATPVGLADSIEKSLNELNKARQGLRPGVRRRFSVRVHNTIPMGSAILLDHKEPFGRIQIESKVYKAAPRKSFAFEVVQTGTSGFYETLAKGYDDLVADGHSWPIVTTREKRK